MRRTLWPIAILTMTCTLAACSAPASEISPTGPTAGPSASRAPGPAVVTPNPSASSAITAELLGPDGPVARDQGEIPLIVQLKDAGAPLVDAPISFEVLSGPAEFPDGFDSAQTDETGVATTLSLVAKGTGEVTIRVSANDFVGNVVLEIK